MHKLKTALFWLLLLSGVCCCAVLLVRRVAAEEADRSVGFAISYSQVQVLSASGGQSVPEWLHRLSAAGVGYLVCTDANEAEARAAAAAAGMALARSGDTARQGDAFLLPPVDEDPLERDPVLPYSRPKGDPGVPLALVENRTRTGVLMPADFSPNDWDGPMVQSIYLFPEYRQHFLTEDASKTPESILFLAVTDRDARLIVLTAMTPHRYDEGEVVDDPAAYEALLAALSERLEARGLHSGGAFSTQAAPRRSTALLAGSCLVPVALLVLFLRVVLTNGLGLSCRPSWEAALLLLGALAAFGGARFTPGLTQTLVAFGTAVLAACWGVLWLCYIARDLPTRWRRLALGPAPRFPLALLGLMVCAFGGGLCVGAILADRTYLLEFSVFTGVKLSQILPLSFSAAALYVVLYRKNPRDARQRVSPLLIAVLGVGVAGALLLVLLRSGDNNIPVSYAELQARAWLEEVLYVRPRTKEFLIAFPALAMFVVACERRVPVLALPLGVLAAVGATSVVNTFCHLFTPLLLSAARALTAMGFGLVTGYLCMGVFSALLRRQRQP